jgi:hypothetical protein
MGPSRAPPQPRGSHHTRPHIILCRRRLGSRPHAPSTYCRLTVPGRGRSRSWRYLALARPVRGVPTLLGARRDASKLPLSRPTYRERGTRATYTTCLGSCLRPAPCTARSRLCSACPTVNASRSLGRGVPGLFKGLQPHIPTLPTHTYTRRKAKLACSAPAAAIHCARGCNPAAETIPPPYLHTPDFRIQGQLCPRPGTSLAAAVTLPPSRAPAQRGRPSRLAPDAELSPNSLNCLSTRAVYTPSQPWPPLRRRHGPRGPPRGAPTTHGHVPGHVPGHAMHPECKLPFLMHRAAPRLGT